MDFATALAETAAGTEAILETLLATPVGVSPGERTLWEAKRYATLGGGKRLRAFLTVEGAQMLGVDRGQALRVGAAVECLHAYSLVHDDLPSMDDDDLRRGKPTTHKAFDEATAILAGDALQTLAFEILAEPMTHPDGRVRAGLCLGLARAAGSPGMVGGQMIDIAAETATIPLDLAAITRLQALKTGALIRFGAEAGAILADDEAARGHLATYATHLGLAFQIQDDILDVEGDEAETGKRVQKDADAGKATFVSLLGLEEARAAAADECAAAKAALAPFGDGAALMKAAADFVVNRSK